MLRHYDRIGLVSPSERTTGGYREYSESDMRRLFHVEGLRSLGLSLAQIADVIDDRAFDPAVMVENVIERMREQITQGRELVQRLEDVQATAAHHRVPATILPGMGHMLMLEPEWEDAAQAIAGWLATVG